MKYLFRPKQVEPGYTDLVRYYFVVCEIFFDEALDGVPNATDPDGNPIGTNVLLQVMTDSLGSLTDADEASFRETISMKIPYFHYFESLSDPVSVDFIFEAKYRVLVYNPATDLYELQDWEEVFINRFKIEE